MQNEQMLWQMYKLRESLLAEAKDSPELKAEAELLEMQMAEKELDAKYAEELKSEKRKSIKYESILSEPSQQLLAQKNKNAELKQRLAELLYEKGSRKEDCSELKAEIKALDQSLAAVFKNYEIMQKKVSAVRSQLEKLKIREEERQKKGVNELKVDWSTFGKKEKRRCYWPEACRPALNGSVGHLQETNY